MTDHRPTKQADRDAANTDAAEQTSRQARELAEKRREARRQMTPDADVDDTTEGEGSPGLNIGGGGGHA